MQNEVFNAKLNEEVLLGDDVSYRDLCSNPNLTQKQREKLRAARKVMLEERKKLIPKKD